MSGDKEYGDYQTPLDFAERVCQCLKDTYQIKPTAIIEPTCGIGNFLKASLVFNAEEYYGIEINPEYCALCEDSLASKHIKIVNSNFFSFSSKSLVQNRRQILILGNPPWVTNSDLAAIGSDNLPFKANFKRLKGVDAITGASNFDICEYMILQLLHEYRDSNAVIAMLCKTSVARNVFKELIRNCIPFEACDVLEFDASTVFGVSASACVLVIRLTDQAVFPECCTVYDFECPGSVKSQFGFIDGQFYSRLNQNAHGFDGQCSFVWRQGIKHDCSRIMELTTHNGVRQNGQGEPVVIEDDLVFPLVKSSMFKTPVIHRFSKSVIVTQKSVREDTEHLKWDCPKTWTYLNNHIELFNKRKSSIYLGAPPFSMFGIGEYSFSQFKVGISGFYKKPLFSVLYSDDGKPVMTDDTSYFIGFDSYDLAYVAMLLLNSESVREFLMDIAFIDAKRPYTKRILDRIDFDKIVEVLVLDDLKKTELGLNLPVYVTAPMYNRFRESLGFKQLRFA